MKLNTIIYGEPVDLKPNTWESYKVVGNGSLQQLINSGKVPLNTLFDQSVIYAATKNKAIRTAVVPWIGVDSRKAIEYQTFTMREESVGMIMTYANYGAVPPDLYWIDSTAKNNAYLLYGATGYGVEEFGKDPYSDGKHLANPTFITGYNWKNYRFVIYVVIANLAIACRKEYIEDYPVLNRELGTY